MRSTARKKNEMTVSGLIRLVNVSRAQHSNRVRAWLGAAHVSRWWGDAADRICEFESTPDGNHAMILCDGIPVGYMRWERVDPVALRAVGLDAIPDGSIDVDLCIGEPGLTGQGIGPQAMRLLFRHLRDTTDAPLAGFCTSVANTPAQAAFKKAGCTHMTSFDDPYSGPCHVYVRWLR
jgi:RimJ/RimL family protein N-acetyltransferase